MDVTNRAYLEAKALSDASKARQAQIQVDLQKAEKRLAELAEEVGVTANAAYRGSKFNLTAALISTDRTSDELLEGVTTVNYLALRDDKPELAHLWQTVTGTGIEAPSRSFPAEGAEAVLGAAFDAVVARRCRRRVEVPELAPVMAYLDSMRAFDEAALPPGTTWESYLTAARRHVAALLARDGAFRLSTDMTVLTCR